ncbi:hypothetical protein JCGZ_25479 [Jatropha curcas]|uniref:Uncharacterized protein n=1 Tax=Jatropha curcas TaxID=180498 RepID=A0A067JLB0_JATCU|nr:hypothetical protein JCGZ_25479 [Jatropha curcas]
MGHRPNLSLRAKFGPKEHLLHPTPILSRHPINSSSPKQGQYTTEVINNHHDATHLPNKCRNGTASPPRQVIKVPPRQVIKVPPSTVRKTTSCSGAFRDKSRQLVQSTADDVDNHHGAILLPVNRHNGNPHQ